MTGLMRGYEARITVTYFTTFENYALGHTDPRPAGQL